ncbi:phospholipid transfer protein-like [Channa argus]|uniref:phospholipid transfer protein-like n=1 Tax=Channa argus TaxID=215402 RepID=UPI00352294E6
MTCCVLYLFFSVHLISPVTPVDPTGIKVRITNAALDAVKNVALTYLKDLVNKPLPDFELPCGQPCSVKGLIVNSLEWKTIDLHFEENSGLLFEIRDLQFTGKLQNSLSLWFIQHFVDGEVKFEGTNVNAITEVKLASTQQGRLEVDIAKCEIKADLSVEAPGRILGVVWDSVRELLNDFLEDELCFVLKATAMPLINIMLEDHSMKMQQLLNSPILNIFIDIDYSLSGDMTVTSNSLDVPFSGFMFLQGDNVEISLIEGYSNSHMDETDMMVYFGISEFFFNSIGMLLYRSGPILLDVPRIETFGANLILKSLGLPQGPVTVTLIKAPLVTISPNGLSANALAIAQSHQAGTAPVAVSCSIVLKLDLKENSLHLLSTVANCKVRPQKSMLENVFLFPLSSLVQHEASQMIINTLDNFFDTEPLIPVPEGVELTDIKYFDGFVVVGGNLNFPQAVKGRDKSR